MGDGRDYLEEKITRKIKGYICITDVIDVDLGATDVVIYPSIEKLKAEKTCWDECGIMELVLEGEVVIKGKLCSFIS